MSRLPSSGLIDSSAPCLLDEPCEKCRNNPSCFLSGVRCGPSHETGLTLILGQARAGDERARGELLALVYDELRRVASGVMRHERPDRTLSPTAVVHEAVIRLVGDAVFDKVADRSYLFAAAARSMREVLIDHARRRAADRHGGGRGALLQIDAAAREVWLRAACREDDDLREGRAPSCSRRDREPPRDPDARRPTGPPPDRTASWSTHTGARPSNSFEPMAVEGDTSADDTGGFTSRAAIARDFAAPNLRASIRRASAAGASCRSFTSSCWRSRTFGGAAVLGSEDPTLSKVDVSLILALVGMIALLWSRCPISLAWLKALELGMIGDARESNRRYPVPADAPLLAARRQHDGAAHDEERRAPGLHTDPHLRSLRSQELATGRARGRTSWHCFRSPP